MAVLPVCSIPWITDWYPPALIPFPFIWIAVAVWYVSKTGWKSEDGWLMLLIPFVSAMVVYDLLFLGMALKGV